MPPQKKVRKCGKWKASRDFLRSFREKMELSSNTSFPFCQTYTPKKKGIHNHKTGPKVLFGSKPFLPSPDPVKKKKLPCSTHQPTDAMKISLANFSSISALGGSAGITAVSVPWASGEISRLQLYNSSLSLVKLSSWHDVLRVPSVEDHVSKLLPTGPPSHHVSQQNPWFTYCHTPSCIWFVILQASCCIAIC